jgi:hypothetical protein
MAGLLLALPTAGAAQTAGSAGRALRAVVAQAQEEPEEEREAPVEGEFVASTIFQGGTLAVRLRDPLLLEMHYFGVDDNEIGMVGLAWAFTWRELRLMPGFAWAFGSESRPGPVITARWTYEAERWLTQGLWVQSLRAQIPDHESEHEGEPADVRHASILDGIHASARIGHLEVGPMVEHIRYREDNEWKGGARGAWRFDNGLKIVGQLLWPDVEARAGLAWEP